MRMLARRMTAMGFGLTLSALALAAAPGAQAAVIYQSIPNLDVAPQSYFCSQCDADGENVGQFFTLGSSATAESLTFTVANIIPYWPTPVTVDIFRDGGSDTLGSNIYQNTFSTFASDTPTAFRTDIVSVNLGSVALSAGAYDIFLFNAGANVQLVIPGYDGGPGDEIDVGGSHAVPSTGNSYSSNGLFGDDMGIQLSGILLVNAPEPMTLMLFGAGLGGLGALRRRRKIARFA